MEKVLDLDLMEIRLPEIVGRGYKAFWNFRGRYRVVKGSRRSKKSKTTALWLIYNLMKYPEANALVVRKTFRTLADSCFTELKWAAHRLGVSHLWEFKVSPLEARYMPTGQKIYFRGLDDPLKIASITCEIGVIAFMWVEEAYEIPSEAEFDTLIESMLGDCPPGLFKQVTLTFNPWNARHWLKARFFDEPDPDIMAITTDYTCNEWLSDEDRKYFEKLKINNPKRYKVAGLGDWGQVEGVIFENVKERDFALEEVKDCVTVCGLDYGYTNDPSAFFVGFIDTVSRRLYVWDEIYKKGLSNRQIFEEITRRGYGKENITADSAEPKSNDELRRMGLRVKAAVKGKDSILHGIQYLQDFEIIVKPRCVNFLTEIENYVWDTDKAGQQINKPVDDFNHLMDAMRYAVEQFRRGGRLKTFSGGL